MFLFIILTISRDVIAMTKNLNKDFANSATGASLVSHIYDRQGGCELYMGCLSDGDLTYKPLDGIYIDDLIRNKGYDRFVVATSRVGQVAINPEYLSVLTESHVKGLGTATYLITRNKGMAHFHGKWDKILEKFQNALGKDSLLYTGADVSHNRVSPPHRGYKNFAIPKSAITDMGKVSPSSKYRYIDVVGVHEHAGFNGDKGHSILVEEKLSKLVEQMQMGRPEDRTSFRLFDHG